MASSSTGMPHSQDLHDSLHFENYSMNGKIIISSLGLLFLIVFIVVVLHIYARRYWRRSNMRRRALSRHRSSLPSFQETSKASGLDKEIVEALPVFTYTPQLFKGAISGANKAAECAVCLADFRQDECCKLLPNCKHFFHTGCIDMWFLSHATCPLCRATPGFLIVDEEAGYPQSHCTTHVNGGFGEHGQEVHRGLWSAHGGRNHTTHGDEEQEPRDDDIPLYANSSLQPRKWRRSFSDKYPCIVREAVLSPAASVLRRTNHVHIAAVAERSLAHVTTDNLRCQKALVAVSSCPSISSLVSPRWVSPHPFVYPPLLTEPKSPTRVLSK